MNALMIIDSLLLFSARVIEVCESLLFIVVVATPKVGNLLSHRAFFLLLLVELLLDAL